MDITQLKGVGAVTANNLNRLSVYTVEDLVKLYPRDYDVYEEPVFISSIDDDTEIAAIEGTVVGSPDYFHFTFVNVSFKNTFLGTSLAQ